MEEGNGFMLEWSEDGIEFDRMQMRRSRAVEMKMKGAGNPTQGGRRRRRRWTILLLIGVVGKPASTFRYSNESYKRD